CVFRRNVPFWIKVPYACNSVVRLHQLHSCTCLFRRCFDRQRHDWVETSVHDLAQELLAPRPFVKPLSLTLSQPHLYSKSLNSRTIRSSYRTNNSDQSQAASVIACSVLAGGRLRK